jgi:site-specific recombinase XerC
VAAILTVTVSNSRCPTAGARLWGNRKTPLRERALWRLLYDSAARAEKVLGLDVPDLDLANRQVRARVKGGDTHLLHFQTAAARLLSKLIAGREAGRCSSPSAAGHPTGSRPPPILTPKTGGRDSPRRWPSSPTSATRTSARPC